MYAWTLITQSPGRAAMSTAGTPSSTRAPALAGLLEAAGAAIDSAAGPVTLHLHLNGHPLAVVAVQAGPDGAPERETARGYLARVREALTSDTDPAA